MTHQDRDIRAQAHEAVAQLAIAAPALTPETTCAEVYELLSSDPDLLALAVVDAGRPIGLVNRHELTLRLADRFGRPLFERKPITWLMDRRPLLIEADEPLTRLEELLAGEHTAALLQGFIITEQGRYFGIGTALSLLQAQIVRTRAHAKELEEAKLAAEAASRAKSMFLANMSHELRTPLNAIIGFTDFIRSEPLGPITPKEYREYIDDVNLSGKHLLNVINAILDMSKIEANRLELHEEEIDPVEVAHSVRRMMRETAKRRDITVAIEAPADCPDLLADPQFLRQILINLISNAFKFSEAGTAVAVRFAVSPAGELVLSVIDEGIGIAPEDIPRVLEPFGRVIPGKARRAEGTGLGLPLCKALAEAHGGRLAIESTPGEGTAVHVVFPPERVIDTDSATLTYLD